MAALTASEIKQIEEAARSTIEMVVYNADKEDAADIPEFISYEVIDLIEWKVEPKIQKQTSTLVLENLPGSHKPIGVEKLVRDHFDLPY